MHEQSGAAQGAPAFIFYFYNSMHLFTRLSLIGVSCFVASCGEKVQSKAAGSSATSAVSYATPGAKWFEAEFTPWMSRAELQYLQENNPAEQYFAHVEGRNNSGRLEYRAVTQPFATDQYEQWAVFWGINEAELFDWELRLLKAGFSRKDMQVFADSSGEALYQIVWLKPQGKPEEQTQAIAEIPTEEEPTSSSPPIPSELVDVPQPEPPTETPAPAAAATEVPAPPSETTKSSVYVVQPGDNLGKIAKRKGVTVADLKKTNNLKSDVLRIGQKLTITKDKP